MKLFKLLFDKFYNEDVEDFATRLLYFFNTLDTYFYIAGLSSLLIYTKGSIDLLPVIAISAAIYIVYKIADFYPLFLLFSPLYLYFLFQLPNASLSVVVGLLLINIIIFILIQFFFMGIPDSIVARDATIGIRKIWNSLFTIAPTTVSFSMSVAFSTLLSIVLFLQPGVIDRNGFYFWLLLILSSVVTKYFRPISFISDEIKPAVTKQIVEKVIVINIDGCRLDKFYEAKIPFLTKITQQASYFPSGLETVYRALTNPAFASILTGTVPTVHGIKDNNLGQAIRVEGLPDLVKTKLYGSMHVKHFSKPEWDTYIVSLPTHGIYKSDSIMFEQMQEDIQKNDGTRLFIADISETDFLGHAYGSESHQYIEALERADKKIEGFYKWLQENNFDKETAIIICSDHGMVRIDHSYLLFDAEKYVPFIIFGKGIKKNNPIEYKASIMDIASTISCLLGINYPSSSKGRVFLEAFE